MKTALFDINNRAGALWPDAEAPAPTGLTIREVTEEQAAAITAARTARPPYPLFLINGQLVDYAAWHATTITPAQQAHKNLASGWDTGLGYSLAAGDADQAQFTKMLVLVSTGLSVGAIQATDPQTFADKTGALHTLPTSQFIGLMLQYGAWIKAQWDLARQ